MWKSVLCFWANGTEGKMYKVAIVEEVVCVHFHSCLRKLFRFCLFTALFEVLFFFFYSEGGPVTNNSSTGNEIRKNVKARVCSHKML